MPRRVSSRPASLAPSRRAVLKGLVAGAFAAPFILRRPAWAQPAEWLSLQNYPFRLGIASGDPDSTSVVLWTRLAPAPLQADGGLPPSPIPVEWEIGLNENMTRIMFRGITVARPEIGHSVHVLVQGLLPGRTYWYRFKAGEAESPTGRTRTVPARDTGATKFRMAVASCQRIEDGYFTAWDDVAQRDLDLVFHAGDYIYEQPLAGEVINKRMGMSVPEPVLKQPTTLEEYRLRYALYRLDPALANAHAMHPFVTTFDDHEVVNNWAGDDAVQMTPGEFLTLRAAAFQAFYENMPVRDALRPEGAAIQAYRSIDVGGLLRLAALDTRQYRSPHACGTADKIACDERHAPERQMLGSAQESWALDLMGRHDTTWTVLGNQVMMMQCRDSDPSLKIVHTDKWDGYTAARNRLLQGAVERKTRGLVVVTGDMHRGIAGNLKADYGKANSPVVGAEFITSSISSGGDGGSAGSTGKKLRAANPHLRFYDNHRGYLLCTFDEKRCEAAFRATDKVSERHAPVTTIATYGVNAGKAGIA